jgi:hypothetical protein
MEIIFLLFFPPFLLASWEKSEIDLINFYVVNMLLSKQIQNLRNFQEKFLPQSHFISFLPMKHNKMFVIQSKLEMLLAWINLDEHSLSFEK